MRNGRSQWPMWLYHPVFDKLLVRDQAHADKVAPEEDGWRENPFSDEEKTAWKQPKKLKAVADTPEVDEEADLDPRPEPPARTKNMSSNAFNKARIKFDKDLAAWEERNLDK